MWEADFWEDDYSEYDKLIYDLKRRRSKRKTEQIIQALEKEGDDNDSG